MISDISKTGDNLRGKEVIIESVKNLLSTTRHSRFFNRGMYSGLEELLFQPPSFVGSRLLKSSITSLILKYLGNYVTSVTVEVDPEEQNRQYRIRVVMEYNGESVEYSDVLQAGGK